jgi:hypothetical protein
LIAEQRRQPCNLRAGQLGSLQAQFAVDILQMVGCYRYHHCFRQWLYVTIFIYFFQNFFHRHAKNKNTKHDVSEEGLSVFIFGVTIEKILEEVCEVPLQAWTGPEGSRRSRLPDF